MLVAVLSKLKQMEADIEGISLRKNDTEVDAVPVGRRRICGS
jgi:hypothetical protein